MRTTVALATLTLVACVDAPAPPGARVAVSVAPLSLSGLTDATYRLRVVSSSDETVWEKDVSSTAYGDGAGAISYVGPCDADASPNRVELEVLSLEDASGALVAGVDYMNPAPVGSPAVLTADCVADADVPVQFDVTFARAAQQGFFDVAVTFDDIFCAAKLDCEDASGQPLELLHDASGVRAPTAVMAFACTAGSGADTHLYLSAIEIACGDGTLTLDPSLGPGRLAPIATTGLPTSHIFDVLVTRGAEQLGTWNKLYWNLAFGLADVAGCTLTATGTASDGLFAEGATPAGGTWPYLAWTAPLDTCTRHALDSGDGVVETRYARPPGTSFPYVYDGTAAAPFTVGLEGSFAPGLPGHYADGTFAVSCDGYRNPIGDQEQATVSGVYTIDPDGGSATNAYDVYCDMTTADGGWTRVFQVKTSTLTSSTAAISQALLLDDASAGNAKLSDVDIRTLALAGRREFMVTEVSGSSTYVMRASDTEWAAYATNGWTNTPVDVMDSGGTWHPDECNGHYNNRGFSTWDDTPYQVCQVVYAGGTRYMCPYHTSGSSTGGPFWVYVR